MLKVLYFFPAVTTLIFYVLITLLAGFTSIHPVIWLFIALIFMSAVLMSKTKWWGCLLGILYGAFWVYKGTIDTHQIMNESPIGMGVCVYYFICGFICYKSEKKKSLYTN